MKHRFWLAIFILHFFVVACGLPSSAPATQTHSPLPSTPVFAPSRPSTSPSIQADIIFTNGDILTMDASNPTAQAIAIQDGKIIAVGSNDEIQTYRDEKTVLVNLAGRTLLPGFVDAHAHLILDAQGSADKFSQIQSDALRGGISTETEMGANVELFNQLKSYDEAGLMKIRWNVYFAYDTNCGDPLDQNWFKIYKQGQDITQHIRAQGVKIWADGGSCHVPAVTFEYPGGYGHGDLYMTQDQLTSIVKEVQAAGYQIGIHALGDRAIEEAQNAIAAALSGTPNVYRHRIEHNAVLHDALLPRYTQIGIIPTIFGSYPTCWRVNSTTQFKYVVPVDLGTWEWPWRALLDANPGIKAAWHSDYAVFPNIAPMAHLYGFVTRNQVAEDGSICQAPAWLKQGAITVDEALHIMTINSAYALFREKEIGSLEAGKLADMIILSENPLKVQPEAIKDINVLMTMIGGKVEYCAAEFETLCPSASSSDLGPASVTVTASSSLADSPPGNVLDGNIETLWSSGSSAPQWIQIDLGKVTVVSAIRLVISQYPEGNTIHQIWVGADANNLTLVHEFKGFTQDPNTLEFQPSPPLTNIRYIKILTTESPSWVAWREIEVNGQ